MAHYKKILENITFYSAATTILIGGLFAYFSFYVGFEYNWKSVNLYIKDKTIMASSCDNQICYTGQLIMKISNESNCVVAIDDSTSTVKDITAKYMDKYQNITFIKGCYRAKVRIWECKDGTAANPSWIRDTITIFCVILFLGSSICMTSWLIKAYLYGCNLIQTYREIF